MTQYQDPALHFLWLEVSDLSRSVNFYRETLGFPVQDDSASFATVHLANSKLYLAPGQPLGMSMHIGIAIADVDAMHNRLHRYNVTVPQPIDEGWARYISLIDPDGYRLLLLQPAPTAPEPGT